MKRKAKNKRRGNQIELGKPIPPELEPPVNDIFDRSPERLGGKEKWAHELEILQLEWAIKYPAMKPTVWMREIKGYSADQAKNILSHAPEPTWQNQKAKVLDKMTESLVKRHIDLVAEVQEQHISASKLGLARAIEMLSNNGVRVRRKDGKEYTMPLRSVDLLNAMSAIEKAQNIYRKAMGLPNDEGGLAQILEKVQQVTIQQNIQNNVQNNTTIVSENTTVSPELAKKLDYDTVLEFIEYRREQKALKAKAESEQKG